MCMSVYMSICVNTKKDGRFEKKFKCVRVHTLLTYVRFSCVYMSVCMNTYKDKDLKEM